MQMPSRRRTKASHRAPEDAELTIESVAGCSFIAYFAGLPDLARLMPCTAWLETSLCRVSAMWNGGML